MDTRIQDWLYDVQSFFRSLRWRMKCYFFIPANVLRIKTLPRAWVDRNEIMLHACFQILVDYIEQEKPFETIDFDATEEFQALEREFRELYHWWKDIRPNQVAPENGRSPLDPSKYICDYWDEEDERMLARLIAIRPRLWS